MRSLGRTATLCLGGLALFSLIFSLLAERGLRPALAPGALHDTDLWAGFAGGLLLLAMLLRKGSHASTED